jgi:leucyl aminopeptidase
MIIQFDNLRYQLLDFKKKKATPHLLESVHFYLPGASEKTLQIAKSIVAGVEFTRHLANMPANICTPTYLGEQAQKLAEQFPEITCQVMGLEDIRQMGMGALMAVAQGSDQPPRLIDIQYNGAPSDVQPIVLVGKGITFDSGGLSIKPANAMDEMKYDMAGAASVLGTIKACALLKLPINLVGLIASAENMLSGSAVKSGDIVTSMSGQTIEIINTDAEGRLVLADALTYAERFNPRFVIDIATLTGGIIVALGTIASGLMTKDDELAALIEKAAAESEDRVWRMPLDEAYQDAIDSPLADMINANFDRTASSVTAACFLSRFTEKYRWAHLDIAGTAWVSGKKRNATGRPVPLLIQLIRHVVNTR